MTAPMNATVALRRPDGTQFDESDIAGLMPGALLVVEVAARAGDQDSGADGDPARAIVTLGHVIGWVPPAQAPFGRTMLTGACAAVNTAAAELAAQQTPQAGS